MVFISCGFLALVFSSTLITIISSWQFPPVGGPLLVNFCPRVSEFCGQLRGALFSPIGGPRRKPSRESRNQSLSSKRARITLLAARRVEELTSFGESCCIKCAGCGSLYVTLPLSGNKNTYNNNTRILPPPFLSECAFAHRESK